MPIVNHPRVIPPPLGVTCANNGKKLQVLRYHETMTSHEQWLTNATGKTLHAIALEMSVDPSNFSKKVKRGLTSDYILELCGRFSLDPIDALQKTGKIPTNEPATKTADQLRNRINRDVETLAQIANEKSNIVQFRPRREYDPTQGIPNDAVADSSPDTEGDLDDLDP